MRAIRQLTFASSFVLLGACSTVPEPTPSGTTTVSPTKAATPTTAGDVAPTSVYRTSAKTVWMQPASLSLPASPLDPVIADNVPSASQHLGSLKVIDGGAAPAAYTLQVDSTAGEAYLFLCPHTNDSGVEQSVLQDVKVTDPQGALVNVRATKLSAPQNAGATSAMPMSVVPLGGHPTGAYTVTLGATAAAVGISLDLRQPQSAVAMQLLNDKVWLLHGNTVGVDVQLTENGAPITGATISAHLVDSNMNDGATVRVLETGGGHYRAFVSDGLGVNDPSGAYQVHFNATGRSPSGTLFERFGQTSVLYAVPTAQVTRVGSLRTVTEPNGTIDAFEVDVDVQATSLDRYAVSATLVGFGTDGAEHPAAEAIASEAFSDSTHTLTLRFDAALVRMTGLEGSLLVRNLKLQGSESLFYREFGGRGVATGGVVRSNLAHIGTLTPALDQMVTDGVLRVD